jgi:hypothetical protein
MECFHLGPACSFKGEYLLIKSVLSRLVPAVISIVKKTAKTSFLLSVKASSSFSRS